MIPYSRITITRITNQDCFRIKTDQHTVIVDPGYIGEDPHLDPQLLQKASLILISHHHFDHLQPDLLKQLADDKTMICATQKCVGLTDLPLTIVKPGESLNCGEITIKVIDAYNTPQGHSHPKNHHQGECVGYVFRINGKNFYFAGDTDVIPQMKTLGPIDVAMLPIGGTYVMDAQEAVDAARLIKPNLVLAMHQMNSDPLDFKKRITSVNIPMVYLNPGESFTL
jgi:L-ascorbate metabolism protein UlaG (beta-lactamase superfamily)